MRNVLWLVLGGLLSVGAMERASHAAGGQLDMLWLHKPTQQEQTDMIKKFPGVLPTQIDPFDNSEVLDHKAESRLETELQTDVKLSDVPKVQGLMSALAKDAKLTEKMLGAGYTVVEKEVKPREMWDDYRDSADRIAAQKGASLRLRTQNGFTALNYKPDTAVRFPNGMAHRIERGVVLKEVPAGKPVGALREFIRDSNHANPVADIRNLDPSRQPEDFFEPSVLIKQQRRVYEIMKNNSKISEITVDEVTAKDARGTGKEIKFGSFELEGDHLNLTNTAQIAAAKANAHQNAPHAAIDTRDPALMASADIKDLHRIAETLTAHFKSNGVEITPATGSKYVRSVQRMGLLASNAPVTARPAHEISTRVVAKEAPVHGVVGKVRGK